MTVAVRLVAEAADGTSGMTLAELGEFVEQAKAAGCSTGDAVTARVTMRGRVKSVGLTAPGGGHGR